ncbi:MAG: 1,6-anhydro-N-acetylmuramyl-L-alanine amidase AmpD [Pseudomonadales bacterium]|jgi:AmpD protein
MKIKDHRLVSVNQIPSPNFDARDSGDIKLIVIHNISLPAGHFGTDYVTKFFCDELDVHAHPDFTDLEGIRVSSHLYIRRDGTLTQFVAFNERAWHAGESSFDGQNACNDFSIGIELEGTDDSGFQDGQYQRLASVCKVLIQTYNIPSSNIVGHSDIAPGRKTDPGAQFNWAGFRELLAAG